MPNPYTIVDAINQVTEVLIPFQWSLSALSAGDDTSIYYVANQFLDRARIEVCSQGTDGNVEYAVAYPASASKVTLVQAPAAYAELSIRGAGPDAYRNLALRWDTTAPAQMRPYDLDNRKFEVTASATGTLYLDVVRLLPWDSLTVKSAEAIIAKAKLAFQRRYAPEQLKDAQLVQELGMTASMQGDQLRQEAAAAQSQRQQGGR